MVDTDRGARGPVPARETGRFGIEGGTGTLRVVDRKVMTAEEFERLPPAEQDRIFASSIITDLADVPPEFLAKVRARVEARLSASDATRKA